MAHSFPLLQIWLAALSIGVSSACQRPLTPPAAPASVQPLATPSPKEHDAGHQESAPNPPASEVTSPATSQTTPPREPLNHRLALNRYVPAAGLRWLVELQPAQLLTALGASAAKLLPEARLEAFTRHSGVDLRQAEDVVVAGYNDAIVYLIRQNRVDTAKQQFVTQLDDSVAVARVQAGVDRISGVSNGVQRTLLSLGDRLLVLVVGQPRYATIALLYARGRLGSPASLAGAALQELAEQEQHRPIAPTPMLRAYATGPFDDRWLGSKDGGLARVLGLSLSVQVDSTAVHAQLTLRSSDRLIGSDALRRVFRGITQGSLGRTLGVDRPFTTEVQELERGSFVTFRSQWEKQRLLAGLTALLVGDARDLLRLND